MRVSWTRTVAPEQLPVTVAFAKLHSRSLVDLADEDPLFDSYIRAATGLAEEYVGRGLFTQTYTLVQDDFCDEMVLPMAAPLQSVTSVQYYDGSGALQTVSPSYYRVDTDSEPGRVVIAPTQTWPVVQGRRGQCVVITYVVGWETVESIPEAIKVGILMLAAHLWENRGAVQLGIGIGAVEVPVGPWALMAPYRVRVPY